MAPGVAQMAVQCVFEGSISLNDMEKERRPYHKNSGCALHTMKSTLCSNACLSKDVSHSLRRSHGQSAPCRKLLPCSLPKLLFLKPDNSIVTVREDAIIENCHVNHRNIFRNEWRKKGSEREKQSFSILQSLTNASND